MIKSADVVVIGSGVIGASVAYFNAKSGAKVILIDRGDMAEGTSSKSDGNILVCDKMPGFDAKFAKASQDMFGPLSKELDFDIQWHQRGSLYIVEDEEQYEIAAKFCKDMVACGLPMRMMDKYEIHQDERYLADDLYGGLETACDGSLYPIGLCYGYALGAKKMGAELLFHNPVTGIDRDGNGFLVHSEQCDVAAKYVVDCAGVWSPVIGRMVGLEIPIQARQGQILVSEQTFRVARRKVHEFGYMLTKFGSSNYKRKVSERVERNGVAFVFEPTASNNFLIGSSRSFVGEDISNDIEVMQALAERAIRFFPVIRNIKVIRGYSGLRPFTPDHLPIVSDTPVPGFYIAAGHEGDGIGLSAITGKSIADMIAGRPTFMDLSPVSYNRFLKQ
ncbi:MAG: FAD-binding oxidoreductase [Lachnospiraceae bacterium]|jgi:glycine/D-amino acid oxidase-like deaminating enzyme|nr:FAD-binding oxidoreductase [Lachnospiraceae bacterium]MCI1726153.1 FAD-binding oxidoreductase [Lachnospiraceae bacterium]